MKEEEANPDIMQDPGILVCIFLKFMFWKTVYEFIYTFKNPISKY